jgi:hypothetical protein
MNKIKSIQITNLHNNGKLWEVGKCGVFEILDKSSEYEDHIHALYYIQNKSGEMIAMVENCPVIVEYDVLENAKPVQKELFPKPEKPKLTIEERFQEFESMVHKFEKYEKTMRDAFIIYWGEFNQTKTKMRFEMQKTWLLGGRLQTWASRNNYKNDTTEKQSIESW